MSTIHRDLKPGKVGLTADGTAKIGDFGLPVSSDRSRLTSEGMMDDAGPALDEAHSLDSLAGGVFVGRQGGMSDLKAHGKTRCRAGAGWSLWLASRA